MGLPTCTGKSRGNAVNPASTAGKTSAENAKPEAKLNLQEDTVFILSTVRKKQNKNPASHNPEGSRIHHLGKLNRMFPTDTKEWLIGNQWISSMRSDFQCCYC